MRTIEYDAYKSSIEPIYFRSLLSLSLSFRYRNLIGEEKEKLMMNDSSIKRRKEKR